MLLLKKTKVHSIAQVSYVCGDSMVFDDSPDFPVELMFECNYIGPGPPVPVSLPSCMCKPF